MAADEWVNCWVGGVVNDRGGWQADLGEYVGPWPLMPSPNLDMFTAGTRIELVIGLPNPAAPDDVTQAFHNGYDSQLWGAVNSVPGDPADPLDSHLSWYRDSYGSMDWPDGRSPPSPGHHLYVIVYKPSHGVADDPPSAFAPSSYCALGGSGTEIKPGGWSDWQVAFTREHAARQTFATGHLIDPPETTPTSPMTFSWLDGDQQSETVHAFSYPVPHVPVLDLQPAAVASMMSKAPLEFGGGSYGNLYTTDERVDAGINPGDPGPTRHSEQTRVRLVGNQNADAWVAKQRLDTVGADLDLWIDYADQPFVLDGPFDHESPLPVIEWINVSGYLQFAGVNMPVVNGTSTVYDQNSTIQIFVGHDWIVDTTGEMWDPSEMIPDTRWIAPAASGMVLAAEPAIAVTIETADGGSGHGTVDFHTLDLAWLMYQFTIRIVWQAGFTDGTAQVPLAELEDPPAPSFLGGGTAIGAESGVDVGYGPVFAFDPEYGYAGLPYLAHNPRWRYWKPSTVGPSLAWHTVGGHWSMSQTVRILTPGAGWVPIVDGPG
jgi:hypothetical protein